MGKKKTKNKRNSELKIIFFIILVAAALFIVSTYAWFTTQKNVSITNLSGIVEVAEGLEISLDGATWANEIVLDDDTNIIDSAYYTDDGNHRNISPVELLPVSTTGILSGSTEVDLKMMRGKVTNSINLSQVVAMDESLAVDADQTTHDSDAAKYPGYFAFDIFLKNSSKITEDNDTEGDILQLNYDSSVQVISEGGDSTVGLQNTVRVALARYGSTYNTSSGKWEKVAEVTDGQADVLNYTGATKNNAAGVYLTDVAIWEPNSSDHVEYIVINNNKITWTATDGVKYGTKNSEKEKAGVTAGLYEFNTKTQMPTYALTETAMTVEEIADLYNWDGTTNKDTLKKQNVLQTSSTKKKKADGVTKEVDENGEYIIESYNIEEGVQNLVSATDGTTAFTIAPNAVSRLRVYVWLEGQDIDCINYASYGGGIKVNLGLVKGSTIGSHGEAE